MPGWIEQVTSYWKSGGVLMLPLALTSFFLFFFLLECWKKIGRVKTGKTAPEQKKNNQYIKNDLLIITALTSAAPLLGLLGTVMGMIQTFNVGAPVNTQVTSGISQALITTQVGLVIAIPGIFGGTRLRRYYNHKLIAITCQSRDNIQ